MVDPFYIFTNIISQIWRKIDRCSLHTWP